MNVSVVMAKMAGTLSTANTRSARLITTRARNSGVAATTITNEVGGTIEGKGGYVRSIARDLGRDLGCFGHVTALRRIWSGPFTLRGAVTWEEIEAAGQGEGLDDRLLPLESALVGLPECPCPEASVGLLRNGGSALVFAPDGLQWGDEAWASRDGRAIAVGHYEGGSLRPTRVFAA